MKDLGETPFRPCIHIEILNNLLEAYFYITVRTLISSGLYYTLSHHNHLFLDYFLNGHSIQEPKCLLHAQS
jgi:hypothetical protein